MRIEKALSTIFAAASGLLVGSMMFVPSEMQALWTLIALGFWANMQLTIIRMHHGEWPSTPKETP